jgi:hypothetical protein
MTRYADQRQLGLAPFFQEPVAYVVVAPGSPERTCIVYDRTPRGPVIRGFLSLFDADLAAHWMNRSGGRFYGQRASLIDPHLFRAPDGKGFALNLHIGWLARQHQVMLGLGGEPISLCKPLLTHDRSMAFEVDDATMKLAGAVYDAAGLFAWRETLRDLENWEPERFVRAHARVRKPLFDGERSTLHERDWFDHGVGYPEDGDQLAVFDPESGQWHFVPRDVVTGGVN